MGINGQKPEGYGNGTYQVVDLNAVRKEKERQWIDNKLEWAKICKRRAEVRRSLRSLFERSPFLAELMGVIYVPSVSANEISMEEIERHEAKLKISAGRERDDRPRETLRLSRFHGCTAGEDQIRKSEKIKHCGHKFSMMLTRSDYSAACEFVGRESKKMKDAEMRAALEWELRFRLAGFYAHCIEERDSATLVEVFMEIGMFINVSREDLVDIKDAVLQDPDLIDKLRKQLAGYKKLTPVIYEKLKEGFELLGLKVV